MIREHAQPRLLYHEPFIQSNNMKWRFPRQCAPAILGRTAQADTDAKLHAEILSWSRTRGVFAGISLKGATLRHDAEDNEALYGRKLANKIIVTDGVPTPPEAKPLLNMLGKYSFKELKG